jgi:adenosylcobinamide-GDP ribazoletransferase
MRSALAFLTVFGGASRPDGRTMGWFPVVGLGLGLVLGGVWWAAAEIWPPLVAAAVVVAADLALTGLLHIDGLADSADGLLPPLVSTDRRLEVMADPVSGAFAVATVAIALLLRTAGLASVDAEPLVLGGLWCASRTILAVAALRLPYAREGGLAADFLDPIGRPSALLLAAGGGVVAVTLLAVADGGRGVGALAATVLAAAAVLSLGMRRLGGFTGDVLGAAAVTGETAGLLVLAIR